MKHFISLENQVATRSHIFTTELNLKCIFSLNLFKLFTHPFSLC